MPIDLSKCEIRTPEGPELGRLFRLMWEVFPSDRALCEDLISGRLALSNWRPYTLFGGGDIAGNVSLVNMRIHLGGRIVPIVGVGSVVTAVQLRRMGVARRLLEHCLGIVDRQGVASILFTCSPAVYEPHGFRVVEQGLCQAPVADWPAGAEDDMEVRHEAALDDPVLDRMAAIYESEYPHYDFKLVREASYWQMYRVLLHSHPTTAVLLCRGGGKVIGYARVDQDWERRVLSELCCPPGSPAGRALLDAAVEIAKRSGEPGLCLNLPSGHFALDMLREAGRSALPDHRALSEVFMLRPGRAEARLFADIRWSLADKF